MTETTLRDATPATSAVASEPTPINRTIADIHVSMDLILLQRDLAHVALRLILSEVASARLKGDTLLKIQEHARRGLGS